jgi:hypothetical protein
MSKKSFIVIAITLFIVFIFFQFAFSTTFRISSIEDHATLITVTQSESSSSGSSSSSQSSGGSHPSPFRNPPIVSAEGNCLNCICTNCHQRKAIKTSAKQTVTDHFRKYWPGKEYRLKEGEKIKILTENAFVAKEKGRLVAYDNGKRILLRSSAKVIKAGRQFFILE